LEETLLEDQPENMRGSLADVKRVKMLERATNQSNKAMDRFETCFKHVCRDNNDVLMGLQLLQDNILLN
jgi:hypothetical protein